MKTTMRAFTCCVIAMLWIPSLHAQGTIVDENLPDRPAVKASVEAIFDLPDDASGFDSVTITNPGSLSHLYLASFGSDVILMAVVYAHRDDEVQPDRQEWEEFDEAPEHVEGDTAVALDENEEAQWKQAVAQHGFSYEEEYLVNYNSNDEVAEYQKTLRAVLSKSAENPSGVDLVMDILDNVYGFDWNEASTKKTVE